MRHVNLARGGALLTAAALSLSLGTGPVSAADSSDPGAFAAAAEAAPAPSDARLATGADLQGSSRVAARAAAESSAVDVTKIVGESAELYSPSENFIPVEVFINPDADTSQLERITLNLSVDGKKTTGLDVYYDEEYDITFVLVPGDVGMGRAKFTGSTLHYTEESGLGLVQDGTKSKVFSVRRGIVYQDPYYVSTSKKKTIYANGIGIYKPSIGDFTSLKKVKLQYVKSGEWKTLKTIELNVNGNGKYTHKTSKKYKYRLYSAVTSTSAGLNVRVGQSS